MKTFYFIIRLAIFFMLPTFLIYIGKDDTFINFLNTEFRKEVIPDVNKFQFYTFFIGTFWAGIFNPAYFEYARRQFNKKTTKFVELLSNNKESYLKLMKKEVGINNKKIEVRLFYPKRDLIGLLKKWFYSEQELIMKHKEGITDVYSSNDLSFIAKKDIQEGMVGKTFSSKDIMLDFDLDTQTTYFLTEKQKILVGNTKFCGTIPIFGKNKNEVKCVLSIDCDEKITINSTEKGILIYHLRYFAAFVDKHLN